MSVSTRIRFLFLSLVLAFSTQALFAASPSARTGARLAWDPAAKQMVLFGGVAEFDRGTGRRYELAETWYWNGFRWVQRHQSVAPSARYSHVMVTDTIRKRILLFGGTREAADLNDMWEFSNGSWKQLTPPAVPPKRALAGAAFDPIRDRLVLFGGAQIGTANVLSNLKDTWEFDGTTWIQRSTDGPAIERPMLAYDAARNEMILVGALADATVKMYRYNATAGSWAEVTPATKPPCVTDSAMTYDSVEQVIVLTGGVCTTSPLVDEVWKWNGTDWAKMTTTTNVDRMSGAAQDFDPERGVLVRFGGTAAFASPRAFTNTLRTDWIAMFDASSPAPRSLFAVASDPARNITWMFGGINEFDYYTDFWQYQNGQWRFIVAENGPASCSSPNAAFDSDRNKLVVVCGDSSTFEWDGTAWKKFADLKLKPDARRFSMMVYDQTLKKSVLFGGYNDINYLDKTWLWDGTQWTEQKNKRPTARSLSAMWFDPNTKKTIVYGGIGRPTPDDAIERYSDMWTLDSTGWTKLTVTNNPGMRYGAQVAVDTQSTPNRVLLFGGLLYERQPEPSTVRTQSYQNDLWEWNGSAWRKLTSAAVPPARQNGALFYDASRREIVLFGGYGGYFFGDTWILGADGSWTVREESRGRRRPISRSNGITGPSSETPVTNAH